MDLSFNIHPCRAPWLGTALLLAVLLTASPARAQRVEAYLSADSVTVGDRFSLTLVAMHGASLTPLFPDPAADDSSFGDLDVLGVTTSGGYPIGSGDSRIDSIVYEVTTFALDTAYVPALPVVFSADEDTLSVASGSLFLPVISLVPDEAEGIQELAPLFEFSTPVWPYALLGMALLVGTGLLLYYLRQKRHAPEPEPPPPPTLPQISPYESAIERLRTLEATANLNASEQIKPFFVELSDVLRTYLEDRLDVPALERTTRELMHELDGRTVRYKLPGGAPQRVQNILELADLVKFADIKPPPPQSRSTLDGTRTTVDLIETKLRQIAMDHERMAPRVHVESSTP
ncbi:MAG: hypothetical protein ACE5G0_04890 [Rhodothermales bacterium]